METATILIIFLASLFIGITGYSVYTAFGPGSKNLRDPFEEHEDQKIFTIYTLTYFRNSKVSYFLITRGVSLKNTEKNKTVKVPINRKV